jgi:hypothetical protein
MTTSFGGSSSSLLSLLSSLRLDEVVRMTCAECGEDKVRVAIKRLGNGKGFVYGDGSRKQWKGQTCPQCVAEEHRVLYTDLETDPLTNRRCRRCDERLPQSQYFMHRDCWRTQHGGVLPEDSPALDFNPLSPPMKTKKATV